RDPRLGRRGAERDGGDVAAVRAPDLPVARHERPIASAAALDPRVVREARHAGDDSGTGAGAEGERADVRGDDGGAGRLTRQNLPRNRVVLDGCRRLAPALLSPTRCRSSPSSWW